MSSEYTETKYFKLGLGFNILFFILCIGIVGLTLGVAFAYDDFSSGGFIAGMASGSAGCGVTLILIIINGIGKVQAPKNPRLYLGFGIVTAVMLMCSFPALIYGLVQMGMGIPRDLHYIATSVPGAVIALPLHVLLLIFLLVIAGLLWIVVFAGAKNIGIGSKYAKENPPGRAPAASAPQAAVQVQGKVKHCTSCGAPNDEDAEFCKSCGNTFS